MGQIYTSIRRPTTSVPAFTLWDSVIEQVFCPACQRRLLVQRDMTTKECGHPTQMRPKTIVRVVRNPHLEVETVFPKQFLRVVNRIVVEWDTSNNWIVDLFKLISMSR